MKQWSTVSHLFPVYCGGHKQYKSVLKTTLWTKTGIFAYVRVNKNFVAKCKTSVQVKLLPTVLNSRASSTILTITFSTNPLLTPITGVSLVTLTCKRPQPVNAVPVTVATVWGAVVCVVIASGTVVTLETLTSERKPSVFLVDALSWIEVWLLRSFLQ